MGRERRELVGPLQSAGGLFTCPRPQSHARPCTHSRTLRGTHSIPTQARARTHTHTPTHVVTGTHTHTHYFLRASPAAGTLADLALARTSAMGSRPAAPRVAGPAARGALLMTARLLRARGSRQSPSRAARRSLRLFVMLIPLPSWCQLPAQ